MAINQEDVNKRDGYILAWVDEFNQEGIPETGRA
jgi:hypothetical protein